MTSEREYRDRLYAAYASTHAGTSGAESSLPAFRRDIAPHLPSNAQAHIVDLGCGQGQLVRQLQKAGYHNASGIDISPEQVALAHAAGIDHIRLGDFRSAFSPGALDAVVATDFFEHLTKPEVVEALDRVHESLRPNGILILRVPNSASPFVGNIRYGDMTHETSFTVRSVRQLAATTGFGVDEIRPCNPAMHGPVSFVRNVIWRMIAGALKFCIAAETGQLRGNIVTQNVVAVLRKSSS